MLTSTSVKDRTAVKLTVSTDLALEAQRLCELQGVPLNLTQAVKAILTQGIRSTQAAMDKQQA
jgi:hypothetical protein